jgi:hypothetical protein
MAITHRFLVQNRWVFLRASIRWNSVIAEVRAVLLDRPRGLQHLDLSTVTDLTTISP